MLEMGKTLSPAQVSTVSFVYKRRATLRHMVRSLSGSRGA